MVVPLIQEPEWYHVSSADNAADITTRLGSTPEDVSLDSAWINGPDYLKEPVESWPMNRNFAERKSGVKLPLSEIRKPYREMLDGEDSCRSVNILESEINIAGPAGGNNYVLHYLKHGFITNDWEKLIRKTSVLFYWMVKGLLQSKNK